MNQLFTEGEFKKKMFEYKVLVGDEGVLVESHCKPYPPPDPEIDRVFPIARKGLSSLKWKPIVEPEEDC